MAAPDTAGPVRDPRPLGATAPGSAGIVTLEKLLHFQEPGWRPQDQPKLELIPPRAWSRRGNNKPRGRDSIPGDAAGEKTQFIGRCRTDSTGSGEKTFGNEIPAFPSPLRAGSKGMEFPSIQESLLGLNPSLAPLGSTRDDEGWLCLEFQ